MSDNTTEPRREPITAQDKRALRHADSIVLRLYQGQATVEGYLRAGRSPNGFEQHHIIYAGGASITDYGRDHGHVPTDEWHRYTGFESLGSNYDDKVRTLIDRMRIGSTLGLRWVRDNNSPLTSKAGLVVDQVLLVVNRPAANGGKAPRPDVYLAETSCTLRNSARMIQLDGSGL